MTTTPQAALLSESEIVACIAKAGCFGTVKMSYESGPYDIDRPSINASRFYEAIEAAILAKLQATQEPVQAPPVPPVEVCGWCGKDAVAHVCADHKPVQAVELPPLPSVGPICYAMRADIELYKVPRVGNHLVGVYDIALWSTDQMHAYAHQAVLNSPCVVWPGQLNHDGYGRMMIKKAKSIRAHVATWEKVNGKVPEGMVLDHKCRNRACVNPSHLEVVTQRENTLRGDGPTAINASKTHCINGHPLSGDNLRIDKRGRRSCKACQKVHCDKWRKKKRIEAHGIGLEVKP